jgi:hypothetical protein
MEMDDGNVFTDAKKSYNKNIKNSKLGTALRNLLGIFLEMFMIKEKMN